MEISTIAEARRLKESALCTMTMYSDSDSGSGSGSDNHNHNVQ